MSPFITFEGIDGSGKTTQARLLYALLSEKGIRSLLVREPGTTALGERLRRLLSTPNLATDSTPIEPMAEVFLFAAARAQLVQEIILPSLLKGVIVISDRYIHSTAAYQGYGRGIDLGTLDTINSVSTQGLKPDLIILLDLEPEEALTRRGMAKGARRFEEEELAFHQRIRRGYLDMAAQDPQRWLIVDATLARKALSEDIWRRVRASLPVNKAAKG
ncbi:MAG: dTMP kinase [Chloroflexota bacterium]